MLPFVCMLLTRVRDGDEVDVGMRGSSLSHPEKGLFSDCQCQASVIKGPSSEEDGQNSLLFGILFYLQGHPQCLKKAMIVGLPADLGNFSWSLTGASLPICGGIEMSTFGGVSQDDNSCIVVILL